MFNTEFLNIIREYELDFFKNELPKNMDILEIGGGTGIQAKLLTRAGYTVKSIDLQSSTYSEDRVFPVLDYDGQTIPYDTDSFDIVFSSNVLEHILQLDDFQNEIKRVLRPKGLCVHAMPTGAWRFWTIIAHYIEFVQRTILILPSIVPTNLSLSNPRAFLHNFIGLFRAYIIPPRHGEFGNAASEIITFSKKHWIKHFAKNQFHILSSIPMGLFYTGHMVFGNRVSLDARKILSKFLGSACVLYKVRPALQDK